MMRGTVHVDLSTKSCVVLVGDHQIGQWAPDITRGRVEDVISQCGWTFAPDSDWALTIDGGVREVVLDPAMTDTDVLLDLIGGAEPPAELCDDELSALLFAWVRDVDTPVNVDRINTTAALTAIAMGCAA